MVDVAGAATEKLVFRLEANMAALEKGMRQLHGMMHSNLSKAERRGEEFEKRIAKSGRVAASGFSKAFGDIQTQNFRAALAGVAGFLVTDSILRYADAWGRVEAQLKGVGLSASSQSAALNVVYDAAQRNGVALGDLGTLYARVANTARELGAGEAELTQITNGVSAAVRINGSTVESARGALIQFAQALGSGTVRAEEFNSIQEGARPILVAVAKNLEGTGGSVAKLRTMILDGSVTSQQFFAAFVAGSAALEAQADTMGYTVGQAFTRLENAFTKLVGELNVSPALATPLEFLADHLATITKLALAAAAAFVVWRTSTLVAGSTFVYFTGLVGYQTAATWALTAATGGATVATRTLTAALAANPFGAAAVAITAVASAYFLFRKEADELEIALADLGKTAKRVAEEHEAHAKGTLTAEEKTKKFAEAVRVLNELQKDAADRAFEITAARADESRETGNLALAETRLALAKARTYAVQVSLLALGARAVNPFGAFTGDFASSRAAEKVKELEEGVKNLQNLLAGTSVDTAIAEDLKNLLADFTALQEKEFEPRSPDRPAGRREGRTVRTSEDILERAAEQVAALQAEANAMTMADDQAKKYLFTQQLLAQAKSQDIAMGPAALAALSALADEYGKVQAKIDATKNAETKDEFFAATAEKVRLLGVEKEALRLAGEEAAKFEFRQRALTEAAEKKIQLTAGELQALDELAVKYAETATAIDQMKQAQEDAADGMRELQEAGVQALEDLILNGKSLQDVFRGLLKSFSSSLLRNLLFGGQGGLAGGVGNVVRGLFSSGPVAAPGRASGGPVNAGQLYRINEGGMAKEYFRPKMPGNIVRSSGGGNVMAITVDLRGTSGDKAIDAKVRAGVVAAVAISERNNKANFGGLLLDHQLRRA